MSNINLELIQSKLPKFYKKYGNKSSNEKSVMYAVLDAIVKNLDNSNSLAERLDASIGIDTTYDEDLEYRWGSILGISKRASDSYDLYRNELKLAIPSRVGGTRDTIIYAIAVAVGIANEGKFITNYIDVVDGWEYSDEYAQNGFFVCIIDLSVGEGAIDAEEKVINAVNMVKASGTSFHVVYKAFSVSQYNNLQVFNYDTLTNISYDNLGVEQV